MMGMALFTFVVPHHLRAQYSALLRACSLLPTTALRVSIGDGVGLCGIAVQEPTESRLCDNCGTGFETDDPVVYEWRPGCQSADLRALHSGCVLGYSALMGKENRCLFVFEALTKEYGTFLLEQHPALGRSLHENLMTLKSFCGVPAAASSSIVLQHMPTALSNLSRLATRR